MAARPFPLLNFALPAPARARPAIRLVSRPTSDRLLRIEVRAGSEAESLIPAWRDLVGRALEPNVFFEPDLLGPALRHLPEGRRVVLLTLWKGEVLHALFPVVPPRLAVGPAELRVWQPPLFACGVPLLDRDGAEAALGALLDHLAAQGSRFGGLIFPQVPADGPFAAALRAVAARSRRDLALFDAHQRAVLPGGPAPAEAGEGARAKTLKEMRRLRRRLGEHGEVRIERARDPRRVRDAVEEFLALEASGWKAARGTALIQAPGAASFVRTMTRELARRHACRVDVLAVGRRPVAAGIVLRSGDRAWFWKTAYDESFARFSPGVQLALDITRAQRDGAGIAATDSCAVQDHPMIDHLWRDRLAVADLLVGMAPRPSAAASAVVLRETYRRRARRFSKRAYRYLLGGTR